MPLGFTGTFAAIYAYCASATIHKKYLVPKCNEECPHCATAILEKLETDHGKVNFFQVLDSLHKKRGCPSADPDWFELARYEYPEKKAQWNKLRHLSSKFGYFPTTLKTLLIEAHDSDAYNKLLKNGDYDKIMTNALMHSMQHEDKLSVEDVKTLSGVFIGLGRNTDGGGLVYWSEALDNASEYCNALINKTEAIRCVNLDTYDNSLQVLDMRISMRLLGDQIDAWCCDKKIDTSTNIPDEAYRYIDKLIRGRKFSDPNVNKLIDADDWCKALRQQTCDASQGLPVNEDLFLFDVSKLDGLTREQAEQKLREKVALANKVLTIFEPMHNKGLRATLSKMPRNNTLTDVNFNFIKM